MPRKYVVTRSSNTGPIEDIEIKGGYQVLASTVDRDVIPASLRKAGMLVYTVASNETWILGPGITNGDWSLVTPNVTPPGVTSFSAEVTTNNSTPTVIYTYTPSAEYRLIAFSFKVMVATDSAFGYFVVESLCRFYSGSDVVVISTEVLNSPYRDNINWDVTLNPSSGDIQIIVTGVGGGTNWRTLGTVIEHTMGVGEA
jgi:hypothetical protein